MDKLHISNEMAQFDLKNRNFYKELTDQEKKDFSNYLMIRWGSSVDAHPDVQEYYLLSVNENLNKNFFAISKHPELQWLCATTVSPNLGKHKHSWIRFSNKVATSKVEKFLLSIYPTMKLDDVKAMASLMTDKEAKELAKTMGMPPEQIKKVL